MASKTPIVMISSTVRDLHEHRQGVIDACLRQGMFPKMMEHLAAADDGGLAESMRLVDEADVYLDIFGHRYGHVPKGARPRQLPTTSMSEQPRTASPG